MAIAKTWKQLVGIDVTQSFNVIITTTRVETIIVPNMNVVRREVVIGFATNLSHESCEFLARRNLNRNSRLIIAKIRVVGTPQMVFTNPIMTKTLGTHVLIKKDIQHFMMNHILTPNFHISYNWSMLDP
jgi:hypothetical protein